MAAMRLTARQGGIVAGMTGFGVSAFVLGWWLDDAAGRSAIKANPPAAEWNIPQPKPADLAADAKIVLAKQPFGAAGERAVTSGPTGGAGAGNPLPTQWRIRDEPVCGGAAASAGAKHGSNRTAAGRG
jgi:hypothetical protein